MNGCPVPEFRRPVLRLKRQVAIKLLTADLTRDETAKQRFLQEAQAASALDHPNICTIYEINETDDGQLYLVMAYYEGETLKQRIERGPLALDEAVDIATQVGQGLAEAHGAGIVHRDIKPANLLIAKAGTVKLLDFGLAWRSSKNVAAGTAAFTPRREAAFAQTLSSELIEVAHASVVDVPVESGAPVPTWAEVTASGAGRLCD